MIQKLPSFNFPRHWLKYILIKKFVWHKYLVPFLIPRGLPKLWGGINHSQILKYGFYQAKHKYGQFRPLMFLVNIHHFQYPDCHTTFNATSYFFEHRRTISRDLRREVILRLTRIQTIKDIVLEAYLQST